MRKAIFIGSTLTLLLLGGCQEESKPEKETLTLTSQSSNKTESMTNSQMSQGVLTKEDIETFVETNLYGRELVSISYDGNYFLFLSKNDNTEEDYTELKVVKSDLTIESQTNIDEDAENGLAEIDFSHCVGVDHVKNLIASEGHEMFNTWELRKDGDQVIYFLDSGEQVDAESGKIIA